MAKKPTSAKSGIKQWAVDDRPREKMIRKGQSALSDAELLAILIQNGNKEKSAVDLARELLSLANNNLNLLAKKEPKDFQKIKGIGQAKAIAVMAALELGRRRQSEGVLQQAQIQSSSDFATILIPLLQDLPHEVFYVLYLNNANKIIHKEMLSKGGLTATTVDIKFIIKNALNCMATAICVAHNHPSGSLRPSEKDKSITRTIRKAADLFEIRLLDHIIVGHQDYYSFSDNNLL